MILYKPSIIKAFNKAFLTMKDRNWEYFYVFSDIHETILYPDYNNKEELKFYPYAKQVLQHLSERKDIMLGLYTCSYPTEIEKYLKFFEENNISFKQINRNCDTGVKNTKYGCYDDKPYYNVLLEDKCGFDAEEDWKYLANYFKLL